MRFLSLKFKLQKRKKKDTFLASTTEVKTFTNIVKVKKVFPHFYKCDFTLTDVTVDIFDRHLSVVFNPALATQDVMDAGCHFVPFIVVTESVDAIRCFIPWVSFRHPQKTVF